MIRSRILILMALCAMLFAGCKSSDDDVQDEPKEDKYEGVTPDDDYVYEMPVIFHVLYKSASTSDQYISATWLRKMLTLVNELYEGGVYAESVNAKVKFVPAETDENGKRLTSPGVEYIHITGDYPIAPYDLMNDNRREKGYWQYIWEPNDYINVMVYNFAEDEDEDGVTLGISHMPYYATASLPDIEGLTQNNKPNLTKDNIKFPYCVSINSLYAQQHSDDRYGNAQQKMYYSTDVVATLAHELGHYLGLFHVFSEADDEDACEDTDYCTDTPSYNFKLYNEWIAAYFEAHQDESGVQLSDLVRREPCDGDEYQATNIMDYAYCYSEDFTQEQVNRMRQVMYYSPLIPGPKKNRGNTKATRAANKVEGIVDLPIRVMKCTKWHIR